MLEYAYNSKHAAVICRGCVILTKSIIVHLNLWAILVEWITEPQCWLLEYLTFPITHIIHCKFRTFTQFTIDEERLYDMCPAFNNVVLKPTDFGQADFFFSVLHAFIEPICHSYTCTSHRLPNE